jgi:superfamily II DNA or RNA helicase
MHRKKTSCLATVGKFCGAAIAPVRLALMAHSLSLAPPKRTDGSSRSDVGPRPTAQSSRHRIGAQHDECGAELLWFDLHAQLGCCCYLGTTAAMAMSERPSARTRQRFDWDKVDADVVKALLEAAYAGQLDDLRRLTSDEQKRRQVARVFGSPPSMKSLDAVPGAWVVLHQRWLLKRADVEDLEALSMYVRRGLAPADRNPEATSETQLRNFFVARRLTNNFKQNLRRQFLRAHRSPQPVRATGRQASDASASGVITLSGQAEPSEFVPYRCQEDARRGLDRLDGAAIPDKRRGLVVLPTGAGKTVTAAGWILDRLSEAPTRRVLWLANQQELLEQAASTFAREATSRPAGFERRMRIISSGHSAASSLVDDDLDIALITWQTLNTSWAERGQTRLNHFLSRPTIVVVDEAHHAGAAVYQRILETVIATRNVLVVGLTATPWPTNSNAASRLRATFPVDIIVVTAEELHAAGILATPIMHTVDTGQTLELSASELRAARGDLPPSVLARLANDGRNRVAVNSWTDHCEQWGKTLVFATNKSHADQLGDGFRENKADVRVLHSSIEEPRGDVLAWFRDQTTPCVLVSVGMLTEGVDLPDARTAMLARPTASRILMRQMIGRVLRGPQAGGEAEAHVVYLRDQWPNFEDILEPVELPDLAGTVTSGSPGLEERRLPPILDEQGVPIGDDILAQVRRMYLRRIDRLPLDPATSSTRLAGYYATHEGNVPVMEHQLDGYVDLLRRALRGDRFQGAPALSLFDDDHPPYPTRRAVETIVSHARTYKEAPPFHGLEASISPRAVAEQARAMGAQTDEEREAWLLNRFDTTLARLAYATFAHFEEAVERELRELRRAQSGGTRRLNAEQLETPTTDECARPALRRSAGRTLPRLSDVVASMRQTLVSEAVVLRIDDQDLPILDWTKRPVKDSWAYWSLKTTGRSAGRPVIRVNRALQAPATQISDAMLEYLVYHELLHDLLPGQGHDAEFRRLEALWPNADQLDSALDELIEKYTIPPSG